jgi:arylsulfatase A-like enzyme
MPIADTHSYVATHGSPWDYDRRVPILFWRPRMPAAARDEPVETVDIMPTLAALIELPVAAGSVDGHCLDGTPAFCPQR